MSVVELSSDDESQGVPVTVSDVLIELDDNLKSKLVSDLKQICEVEEDVAKHTLEANNWNMQKCIDCLLSEGNSTSDSEEDEKMDQDNCVGTSSISEANDLEIGKKAKKLEENIPASDASSSQFSNWAPERISILSWNLDGLDDKNLEKRMDAVVKLVEKEKHDILFFQELLPHTFEYIARRLLKTYHPIIGTEDPDCDYLIATFLKKNAVHYESHYIMPFPNSCMGRTLLVTHAFVGQAKLALLNTHLESTAEFSKQREAQLKTCLNLSTSFTKEYNVIFGGDLNLRDKEVESILPSSMADLWVYCGARPSCQYTWDLRRNTNKQMPGNVQPKCRFDRLYLRKSEPPTLRPEFFGVTGIEKVPQTESFPSDHWAIISFFALTKEAREPRK